MNSNSPNPSPSNTSETGSASSPGDLAAVLRHTGFGDAPLKTGVFGGPPPKLYRIGEIVDYVGVSRQTIHNYAIMGLLHEARWTTGGHRLFDEGVFHRLRMIAELKAHRKSMQEIRECFQRLDARQEAQTKS